jgi:hypothetical protein
VVYIHCSALDMMICCGKEMGMLGACVWKMKALTAKMETVILIDNVR